jgi:hypothetical protein
MLLLCGELGASRHFYERVFMGMEYLDGVANSQIISQLPLMLKKKRTSLKPSGSDSVCPRSGTQ